jgi:hypothetical protein
MRSAVLLATAEENLKKLVTLRHILEEKYVNYL